METTTLYFTVTTPTEPEQEWFFPVRNKLNTLVKQLHSTAHVVTGFSDSFFVRITVPVALAIPAGEVVQRVLGESNLQMEQRTGDLATLIGELVNGEVDFREAANQTPAPSVETETQRRLREEFELGE